MGDQPGAEDEKKRDYCIPWKYVAGGVGAIALWWYFSKENEENKPVIVKVALDGRGAAKPWVHKRNYNGESRTGYGMNRSASTLFAAKTASRSPLDRPVASSGTPGDRRSRHPGPSPAAQQRALAAAGPSGRRAGGLAIVPIAVPARAVTSVIRGHAGVAGKSPAERMALTAYALTRGATGATAAARTGRAVGAAGAGGRASAKTMTTASGKRQRDPFDRCEANLANGTYMGDAPPVGPSPADEAKANGGGGGGIGSMFESVKEAMGIKPGVPSDMTEEEDQSMMTPPLAPGGPSGEKSAAGIKEALVDVVDTASPDYAPQAVILPFSRSKQFINGFLPHGAVLYEGESILSSNRRYGLVLTQLGHLLLWEVMPHTDERRLIWSSTDKYTHSQAIEDLKTVNNNEAVAEAAEKKKLAMLEGGGPSGIDMKPKYVLKNGYFAHVSPNGELIVYEGVIGGEIAEPKKIVWQSNVKAPPLASQTIAGVDEEGRPHPLLATNNMTGTSDYRRYDLLLNDNGQVLVVASDGRVDPPAYMGIIWQVPETAPTATGERGAGTGGKPAGGARPAASGAGSAAGIKR